MLRELRIKKGFTQGQLAEKLGISKSHVEKIESGKRGAGLGIALRLSKLYRKPITTLFPDA